MKILVPIKCVPDPDHQIRVAADGKSVDLAGVPLMLNPFDAIALEEAVRIGENSGSGSEIITLCVGSAQIETKFRTTLAVGADRAIRVDAPDHLDPWNVALALEAVTRLENPDLVIMGKQAVDDDSNQAGQFLAARLDWPQVTFSSRVEAIDGGLRIERESDHGIETLVTPLPAVVTCDLRLNEPRYASLPAIMKAKRKPLELRTLDQLGVALDPKIEILSLEAINAARQCTFVDSAEELIARLRDETKVLS